MTKRVMSPKERKLKGFPLHASSVVQGFHVTISDPDEAALWITTEVDYWRDNVFELSPIEGGAPLSQIYISGLKALEVETSADLSRYFEKADKLQIVVGTSRLGHALREVHQYDPAGASALVVALTESLQGNLQSIGVDYRRSVRAGLLVAPAMLAARGMSDLEILAERSKAASVELDQAREEVDSQFRGLMQGVFENHRQHTEQMAAQQSALSAYISETEADLTRIKDLYHKHVQTEAAATYWSNRAKRAWWAGVCSLGAFIVMVMGPLALGYINIEALKDFVIEIGTTSQGQLSLTPLVAVSVPVLAYGWILRHISRLFIQSFTQADDARYRNVMTMTFLGLTKDKTSGVTDAERGIIMNALFRPTPPNTSEDGPPNGLLDLIKGAKT